MQSSIKPIAVAKIAAMAACLLGLVLGSAPARSQQAVTDFSAGQGNGVYTFPSWTPKSLPEFMKGEGREQVVNVAGHLFLPAGTQKVPAVVLMHGSGGIYSAMLDYWPKQFNSAGIAVFAVDSFGSRGIKSTADDQSALPFAADSADSFAALKLLATHPRIDPKRIAVMGFSRGGITTWRAAIEPVIRSQRLPDGLRFAAHIPLYSGGCTGAFRLVVKPGVFSGAPMLWVHGDADDYTPIGPCKDYAERIGKAGTPVEFVTIEGAYHKFDQDDQRRIVGRAFQRTLENCPVEMDISTGAGYDRFTGGRLPGEAYQAALKGCSARGATIEGNYKARDKAAQATVAFLRKVFALQ